MSPSTLSKISKSKSKDPSALSQLWRSPWTTWIGLRYLKSKKNSRFLSFITLLSILGVGLGVTAMIVVLSVMDGFEAELKKRLISADLHVLIQPTPQTPGYQDGFVASDVISETQREEWIRKSGNEIQKFWPIVSTDVILKAGQKVAGAVLKGVPPDRLDELKKQMVETAESNVLPQSLDQIHPTEEKSLSTLFLGQELAFEMGLLPGDEVTLISPTETEGPMQAVPRLKKFVVEGIYHTGVPEQELHVAFTSENAARSFLRRSNIVSQWEVTVKHFDQAPDVAKMIRADAPLLKVQDWIQLNSHLFASLRLERISMFVILAFIIVVASFNIVTTLTLMVIEKRKEISILKAMGAKQSQVAAIFLAEGILIGTLGVGGGIGFGFFICTLLRRYEFITLPDIYYDRTLPVTFDPLYYLLVATCALVIVLGACLYPSKRAAGVAPIDGIRYG